MRFARVGPAILRLREGAQRWSARVVETADALQVGLDGPAFVLEKAGGLRGEEPTQAAATGVAQDVLQAPLPGRLVKVAVHEGEAVDAGQLLVALEAMKMEHTIMAPCRGVVARVRCAPSSCWQRQACPISRQRPSSVPGQCRSSPTPRSCLPCCGSARQGRGTGRWFRT